MIQGIIDIGSNTVRMAVYQIEDHGVRLLLKKKHTVGLAAYIQENKMQQEGIDRACEVLAEFKLFLDVFHIEHVVSFATAALRNVENSREAACQITERTKISVNIISGAEEADLAFRGATNTLAFSEGILIDIGGASTELVMFKNKKIQKIFSLPLGSLFVHKKYVKGLLPSRAEAEMIRGAALKALEDEKICGGGALDICGIGGTFKGACQLNRELYSRKDQEIAAGNITAMIEKFICDEKVVSLDLLDILVKVVPERIKTIVPGMILADTLVGFFGSRKIVYSDSGVREGYIYKNLLKSCGEGQ